MIKSAPYILKHRRSIFVWLRIKKFLEYARLALKSKKTHVRITYLFPKFFTLPRKLSYRTSQSSETKNYRMASILLMSEWKIWWLLSMLFSINSEALFMPQSNNQKMPRNWILLDYSKSARVKSILFLMLLIFWSYNRFWRKVVIMKSAHCLTS